MKKIFIILVFLSVSFGSQSEEIFLSCECEKVENHFYQDKGEGVLILVSSNVMEQKKNHKNPWQFTCEQMNIDPENTLTINNDAKTIIHKYLDEDLSKYLPIPYKITETTDTNIIAEIFDKDENTISDISTINVNRLTGEVVKIMGPMWENDSLFDYVTYKTFYKCKVGEKLF